MSRFIGARAFFTHGPILRVSLRFVRKGIEICLCSMGVSVFFCHSTVEPVCLALSQDSRWDETRLGRWICHCDLNVASCPFVFRPCPHRAVRLFFINCHDFFHVSIICIPSHRYLIRFQSPIRIHHNLRDVLGCGEETLYAVLVQKWFQPASVPPLPAQLLCGQVQDERLSTRDSHVRNLATRFLLEPLAQKVRGNACVRSTFRCCNTQSPQIIQDTPVLSIC